MACTKEEARKEKLVLRSLPKFVYMFWATIRLPNHGVVKELPSNPFHGVWSPAIEFA